MQKKTQIVFYPLIASLKWGMVWKDGVPSKARPMQFDQALMESVVPAAVLGLVSIVVMATTLRWWRGRIDPDESHDMRARIASAAPDPHLPVREAAAPRAGTARVLSSSFVGRDRSAIPLE